MDAVIEQQQQARQHEVVVSKRFEADVTPLDIATFEGLSSLSSLY